MAQVRVRTRPNRRGIEALLGPGRGIYNDTRRRAIRVQNRAKQTAPVDKGQLRSSYTVVMRKRGRVYVAVIGSGVKHALYVEKGTGIYAGRGYITPKRGRFLRWPARGASGARVRGKFVYARRVRGQEPQNILKNALAAARN